MLAIMKKEFKSYLLSPIGYIFIGLFLLMFSIFFVVTIFNYSVINFEYLFYNGVTKQPERHILKLSDLYQVRESEPKLELEVLMLNINEGNNEELKNNCQILKEYMLYVNKIRSYMEKEKMSLQDAVEIAVNECIKEGILEDFLRENRAEVVSMSILEFDAEREWRLIREAEYQYGLEDGIEQGIEQGLKALVDSLKTLLPDVDAVYNAVIKNEIYKNITKEQVEEYFK